MKRWQPNAKRAFAVSVESTFSGRPATAYLMDATEAAKSIGEIDLIYIDPPYNSRQYVAYYHIPEILARGWSGHEPAIRGKVGLLAGSEGPSQWAHGRRGEKSFTALVGGGGARRAMGSV